MKHEEGDFFVGCFNGILLSIPLWLAMFGWVKILLEVIES